MITDLSVDGSEACVGELAPSSSPLLMETGRSLSQSVLLGEGRRFGCALPLWAAASSFAELLSGTETVPGRGPEWLVPSEALSSGRQ